MTTLATRPRCALVPAPAPALTLALTLGFGLGLLLPAAPARADLGTALGAQIGQSLPQYRKFQHKDPGHPAPLETARDVVRVPASRVLGLMAVTLAGPRAGAVRAVRGRGIALEALTGEVAAAPGGPVTAAFSVRSAPVCPEPATCIPYTPPVRRVLLVPARPAASLAVTPAERLALARADAALSTLVPEPGTPGLKTLSPAEIAALPVVPGTRELLPYGFAAEDTGARDTGASPGLLRLAFRRAKTPAPPADEDITVVFAVIDETERPGQAPPR